MGECHVHGAIQGELISTARYAMHTLIQTIEEGEDFVTEDREKWLVLEEVAGVTRRICGFFREEITNI
jgi:hypothetical protein